MITEEDIQADAAIIALGGTAWRVVAGVEYGLELERPGSLIMRHGRRGGVCSLARDASGRVRRYMAFTTSLDVEQTYVAPVAELVLARRDARGNPWPRS